MPEFKVLWEIQTRANLNTLHGITENKFSQKTAIALSPGSGSQKMNDGLKCNSSSRSKVLLSLF